MSQKRKRLGDILIEANVITQDQLSQALLEQKQSNLRLGDQLIEMNLVTEQQIIEVLEYQLGIPQIDLNREQIDPKIINIINEDLARRYNVIPIKRNKDRLNVAMSDPLDYFAIDDLRLSTGFQIEPLIAKKENLKIAINRYYGMQKSIEQLLNEMSIREDDPAFLEAQQADDSPVAKMINQIIYQAVQLEASDIHIDPHEFETVIRFRVDGVLRTERTLPRDMQNILVSRIKILTKLNIAERRLPQDGRFKMDVDLKKIDIRVAILPTLFGEKVVLRLLDVGNVSFGVEKLGFSPSNEKAFRNMIGSAYGIVLVTGPTGSGKSTTLYTALQHLNTDDVNIITVEDPVEYQQKGINQVQVNSNIGMTFATGLRSILRQDPDIIMVGEIRDTETAEIALRSAMTGHLVLSTLHTNDAIGSISRLMDMGVEPFLISSSLIGVIGQRLVRKVCGSCTEPHELSSEEKELFIQRGMKMDSIVKGTGCPICSNTGYKGRIAIQETLPLDDQLRELIAQRNGDSAYRQYAMQRGFVTMFEDGLMKVSQGLTTLEEVYRVTVE
ncbi:ATPase, T2SS/T4P/T4SS family [Alkalihalobacillus sp. MEB130]|uniref:GspE/PulE family protein n=1 Tax=Alkalihalobacillus sp. MEB130 TaxID=2976704 RepID=UPI0028DE77ED|nr:ATPase, T2SS/T4P/T4SS family [Alkalihalobacillus sp. MEB130]MDT8859516.1 ATPase, T2SS/T4P/T4SS family [Alkalihalobacillus sp. MEB130]